ncbi:MAG: hypothetical protein HOP19_26135, partial [Acidobacteria bacterium]|nr:hypothetical protein [Acidobacteriota bacterium]
LSFVQVRNGGESVRGRGAVIIEGASIGLNNTQVTGSASGGIIESQGGLGAGLGTTLTGNTSQIIDTIAGGIYGEGNLAADASVLSPLQVATDNMGRGVFFIDSSIGLSVLRFVNTTRNPVTIAGKTVPPGTITTIAGGGTNLNDNAPGLSADLGPVTGMGVSNTGDRVYFIDSVTPAIRFLNISTGSIAGNNGITIERGNIGTLFQGTFGITINGLGVHPTTGDVYFCDTANKIYRISPTGGAPVLVAGSGETSAVDAVFEATTPATQKLLEPRAVVVDSLGNIYVADTGHNRVVNVGANPVKLVVQLPRERTPPTGSPYKLRPFPAGLALVGNQLYIANRAAHNIVGTENQTNPADVAGVRETACEYSDSNCGDGGPRTSAQFKFIDSGNVGIAGDANGLFVCDQAETQALRGRVRYVNLSNNSVEVAGKVILSNRIDTVFGSGFSKPFDGGLASSAQLTAPGGVALDPINGGLWISEGGSLRFVNRSLKPVTIFAGTASALTVQPGRIATANAQAGEAEGIDGVQIKFGGFDTPQGLWATTEGIYIADTRGGPGLLGTNTNKVNRRTSRIRFVNTSNQTITFYPNGTTITVAPGVIKTIAGGNPDAAKSAMDGPDPLEARLVGALDIAVHPVSKDIYLCEAGNKRVRRINRVTGAIASIPVALLPGATDPGVTSTAANVYTGLTFDNANRLWVVDAGTSTILREKADGSAFTTGFDKLIVGSPLRSPRDVAVDSSGTFAYVTNAGPLTPNIGEHRVMRLTISGNTATAASLAGQAQVKGYSGDYGAAGSALLNLQAAGLVVTVQPCTTAEGCENGRITIAPAMNIIIGLNGEIIFTDSANNAIRRIR